MNQFVPGENHVIRSTSFNCTACPWCGQPTMSQHWLQPVAGRHHFIVLHWWCECCYCSLSNCGFSETHIQS